MLKAGDSYSEVFSYTQEQVSIFAELSGDKNPLHLDAEYAATTMFKKPIIHGILGASILSKILGMHFPGEGTVYLKQEIDFKRPMYVDVQYEAQLKVVETNTDKHTAIIETKIVDKESGKVNVLGNAHIMHKEKI
ncbi:MaoC family dehydratase [Cytophaga hutchinsonii]|uniref:Dehydrogenase with MaoC-like domain n=1 Tax=Cytophaga hutchinsonii (strain ATCC 33406 / DSM 1761 / CIP 103989 / NBRC 15051 / NCIMB 9469 / D465) TaxID=269798 RepID=A0A6N4SPS4_CYTH3|nr:MaoC family dehydratase [Cytophaga hutchinsonii]ABG58271.1 dehydrogenase with MaoC-like domain [Cytophaga hutchinsonii ATCC 33406]SFX53628.1 Acyl dehydratase [Cytophaga hutchinsonii ATCC 33406]